MATLIQWRRGTASQWTSSNPTLAQGEPGFELDTLLWKVGDGVKNWGALPYASGPPGPTGPQGPPGTVQAEYTATWRWTTSLTTASSSGNVGVNAATWSAVTQININKLNKAGNDVTIHLARIKPGDELYLQAAANANNFGRYLVGASGVDQGNWRSFAVTYETSGGVEPNNNADTSVSLIVQGAQIEQWWTGSGAPASTLGNAGDMYFDTASGDVYEKTDVSTWTLVSNIHGATGPAGPQGAPGVPGAQGPAGPGVPAGGATGTILTKTSATDYATAWNPAPVALPPGGATGQSLTKKSATDGDAQWSTLDNLIYDGAYVAGNFKEGEIAVYQGVAYMAVRPTSAIPAQWPMPPSSRPSYATTLPANPYDGQEAILVDSVSNPTYQWRFRFNASSTSAYKWEFVGGGPYVNGGGSANFAGATPTVPTGFTAFTIPRTGLYNILFGAFIGNNGGWTAIYAATVQMYIAGVAVGWAATFDPTAGYASGSVSASAIAQTPSAGQTLDMRCAGVAGPTTNFSNCWYEVIPVRVS